MLERIYRIIESFRIEPTALMRPNLPSFDDTVAQLDHSYFRGQKGSVPTHSTRMRSTVCSIPIAIEDNITIHVYCTGGESTVSERC